MHLPVTKNRETMLIITITNIHIFIAKTTNYPSAWLQFPLSLAPSKSVIEKDTFRNESILWNTLQYNCTTIPINFFAISQLPEALYFFSLWRIREEVSIGLISPTNLQNSELNFNFFWEWECLFMYVMCVCMCMGVCVCVRRHLKRGQ